MSTHDGRPLLERCGYCKARAGEPCFCRTADGELTYYVCPDKHCEQYYEKANDALNCMMHERPTTTRKIKKGEMRDEPN